MRHVRLSLSTGASRTASDEEDGYVPYGERDLWISSDDDDDDDVWGTMVRAPRGVFSCCGQEWHYSIFGLEQCKCCDGPYRDCDA